MLFLKDICLKFYIPLVLIFLLQSCSLLKESQTEGLLRQARDLEFAGHTQEAEKIYDKISHFDIKKAGPIELAILLNQARFYLKLKNYDKTLLVSQKAKKVCESVYGPADALNASILFLMASAYEGLGEYDKATANCKGIMLYGIKTLSSKNMVEVLPLIKLGDIQFQKGNPVEALKFYKEAYALGGLMSTDMMFRVINYRMALCSMSLGDNSAASTYFKNSLPHAGDNAAPMDIVNKYIAFELNHGRAATLAKSLQDSKDWPQRHKEYVDFQHARSSSSAKCVLMDKYTEQDYYAVDAIKKSTDKHSH